LILVVSEAAAFPYDFRENYKGVASINEAQDPARLPYDVAGVVGGYVLTVIIWGVLLLTFGRRMRRKALEPPKALELELQKPIRPSAKTAPLGSPPLSARSATSWLKKFKKNDSAVASPQSPVLGSPTSFDQKVIADHNARAQEDMERLYAAVMDHDAKKNYSNVSVNEIPSSSSTERDRRRPSAISTTRSQNNDDSPISPVKAIYPPGYHNGPVTAPMQHDRLRDQQPPASPRSIVSKRSQNSLATSNSKSTRFNLKNLRISGPVQRYPGVDSDDEAHTPLSPRFYQPGAPPSPPTQQNSPTTPYDRDEELDRVQPLPRPAPQRLGSQGSATAPGISLPKSAASSTNNLPLRNFAEPLRSPGIQTTVLDRRNDKLSLTTPKTGVPFTPYSPYMPFTPITPVTPHLVSKRDRKAAQKVEGRRLRALKEDMVQSPKEIFGDAY